MYEQFKPPTDNLYKFLALSGLIVFLFFGWQHLRGDLAIIKHEIAIDKMIQDIIKVRDDYALPQIEKIDRQIGQGKLKVEDAMPRLKKLLTDRLPEEERLEHEFFDLAVKGRDLPHNDDPERIAILIGAVVGLVTTVAGFWLWYRRVQRPLDEIMRYDLEERRQKATANKAI
jgi:hypothetical protein